jgi:hypothetical protein
MSKPFNFDEFLLTVVSVKTVTLTVGANGGLTASAADRITNWGVCLQPLSQAKIEEFAKRNIHADHVLYSNVLQTIYLLDVVTDGNGEYEVMGWENQGGTNPLGNVFAAYLRRRVES